MRLGWPGPGKAKFSFFWGGRDGCTRVINCHDGDLIHDVVGYVGWEHLCYTSWVTFLISLVLFRVKVSLMMTPLGSLVDSVVDRITLTFLGSGSVANCDADRCWKVRRNCCRCGAPRPETPPTPAPWNTGRVEGVAKALLAGTLLLDLATCRPRFGNRVSCLPRGPPGAGVGTPPKDADSAA